MDQIFFYIGHLLKRFLGMKRHLKPEARRLVGMIGLYDFTFALSSVFVNIFLFKAHNDWNVLGAYNMTSFVVIVISFYVGGILSKKRDHLVAYQLGFVFHAALFLTVLLLREHSSAHPIMLGILAGLGIGFYYLGQHALTLDVTRGSDKDYFFSISLFLSSVLRIAAPAFAGWTITALNHGGESQNGYYAVFALTLAVYLFLIYESFKFKRQSVKQDWAFWDALFQKNNADWDRLMASFFLMGLRNGVFWFGIAVLVYRVTKNELAVGSYGMMTQFLAVGTAVLLTRWATKGNRAMGLWASAILTFLACAVLSFRIDYGTLLLFALFNAVATSWFQVVNFSVTFEILEKARDAAKRRIEYLAMREVPLGVGRILGLSFFLWGIDRFGEVGLRSTILVLGMTHFAAIAVLPRQYISLKQGKAVKR